MTEVRHTPEREPKLSYVEPAHVSSARLVSAQKCIGEHEHECHIEHKRAMAQWRLTLMDDSL